MAYTRRFASTWLPGLLSLLLLACSGDDSADTTPGGDDGSSAGTGGPPDGPPNAAGDGDATGDTGDSPMPGGGTDQTPTPGGDDPAGPQDPTTPAAGDGDDDGSDPPTSTPGAASLSDGLVAHYTFDAGDLSDQTGSGHDASIGMGADCSVEGAFDGGCRLESRGHLQVASSPLDPTLPGGWSASGWINVETTGMNKYLFVIGTSESLAMKYVPGGVLCVMKDQSNNLNLPTSAMNIDSAGSWHHVACVYDRAAGTLTGYANGVPGEPWQVEPVTSIAGRNHTMGIGCMPDPIACTMTNPFTPMIVDDLRIWERPLSAEEVESLADAR